MPGLANKKIAAESDQAWLMSWWNKSNASGGINRRLGPADDDYFTKLKIETAFFKAVFPLMGCVAKADGRVSEAEIELAKSVMDRLHLKDKEKKEAVALFTAGKSPAFDPTPVLHHFRQECGRQTSVYAGFMEVLVNTALEDGGVTQPQYDLLSQIAEYLKFPVQQLNRVVGNINNQRQAASQSDEASEIEHLSFLDADYQTLGVLPTASDAEVKKAYRRLMAQNHPDRLQGEGVADELVELTTLQVHEIRAAYDRIVEAREDVNK